MVSSETDRTDGIPALGPFSSRQVALLLWLSCLAFASGLVAMAGAFAAMIALDRPALLEYVLLVNGLWVLPPAMVVVFINGKLDDDVSWRWVLSLEPARDPS